MIEDADRRRQGLGQPRRLPGVPRLWRLGRRHRPGRLCELRPARGLRGPRKAGRRRQGQDRPGPLRRDLPRPEGPQRPEARGEGHPDLLRPGRRRLRQGGRLPQRPVPARARRSSAGASSSSRSGRATPRRPTALGQGGEAAADRRVTGSFERVRELARLSEEWEKATGLIREDYFATIPSLPISYDAARPILEALGGPNVPRGWQGGLPLAYHVGPGPAEVQFSTRDGLPGPTDLERDRDDPRGGRARPLGHDRQPPRRLGLRRGRSGQRDGGDPGDVPGPGRGGQARLEAAADARLRELGRRGIRPGRLDRVGRRARQGDRREGRAAAERRLGRLRATNSTSTASPRSATWCSTPPRRSPTSARAGPSARSGSPGSAGAGPARTPSILPDRLRQRQRNRAPTRPPPGPPRDSPPAEAARLGLGLHGLRRPPGRAGHRRRVQRAVRSLSFDLRRFHLDGEGRRPRVPHPRHGRAALHGARHAGRGGRGRPAQVRPLWRGAPRLRRRPAAADRAQAGAGRRARKPRRIDFEGLPGLVKAIRGFQDQAAALDRATDALARRDGVPREKLAGSTTP